jgi:hypothetical protein
MFRRILRGVCGRVAFHRAVGPCSVTERCGGEERESYRVLGREIDIQTIEGVFDGWRKGVRAIWFLDV